MVRVKVEFFGKSAHASAAPDMGINALEAMIQLFVNINGIRQHLRKDAVIHGVITDGGRAANVIPAYTSAQFSVRGSDYRYRDEVLERLRRCAEAAAISTGCRAEVTPGMGYDNVVSNQALAGAFERNLHQLGLETEGAPASDRIGSTDMGDVSQMMPAIHPYLSIAPETVGGHTVEFAEAAGSPRGHAAMINAAKALAMTCLDLFYERELLAAAKAEFQERLAAGEVRGGVS
jgi:metal-dependent amidase/aminoacylase/carboxypeptidase family protein